MGICIYLTFSKYLETLIDCATQKYLGKNIPRKLMTKSHLVTKQTVPTIIYNFCIKY